MYRRAWAGRERASKTKCEQIRITHTYSPLTIDGVGYTSGKEATNLVFGRASHANERTNFQASCDFNSLAVRCRLGFLSVRIFTQGNNRRKSDRFPQVP